MLLPNALLTQKWQSDLLWLVRSGHLQAEALGTSTFAMALFSLDIMNLSAPDKECSISLGSRVKILWNKVTTKQ